MILKLLYLFLFLQCACMYQHQKPLAEKIWTEKCKKNSVVLNDCNWCWCDLNQRYQCRSRICEEIDMFGHFKDSIRDIDAGMEGRGSWRSKQSSCTSGVHYRRGSILCVCDEDGNWPNPACRDLFRVLYPVETTGQLNLLNNDSCKPMKLYLISCNVCFCPSTSILDPALCTNRECVNDDPVLEAKNASAYKNLPRIKLDNKEITEVYASCRSNFKYKLGCKDCNCISNNRLLCNKCPFNQLTYNSSLSDDDLNTGALPRWNKKHYCSKTLRGKIFYIDCNSCHCDEKLFMYCTTKECIQGKDPKLKSLQKVSLKSELRNVVEPPDFKHCIPGTKFKKECNTCKCYTLPNGLKVVDCTLMKCSNTDSIIETQKLDCVNNTFYVLDCMICHCWIKNNVKHQVCYVNTECINGEKVIESNGITLNNNIKKNLQPIDSLHGYCEPLHFYKKECNSCRCLTDGKTLMCTSKICNLKRSENSLTIDFIPVYMKVKESCPKGQSYKIDCNLCFCLANGNAICTTAHCSNEY